jgi:gag-polypeptide of LTR copia-type
MDGTSGSSIAVPHRPRLDVIVFDGKDFGLWKMRMEGLFMAHDILSVVETNVAELAILGATGGVPIAHSAVGGDPAAASSSRLVAPTSGGASHTRRQGGAGPMQDTSSVDQVVQDQREELIKKSYLAYGILIQSLKDEQLRLVQGVARGNAYGIWKILLETYERKSMATRVQLLERLFGTQLRGNESIASYVARLTEIERRLRAQGEQVSESIMVYLLLKGLPPSYTSIVQLMKMKEKLEFTETVEALKNEEERQNVSRNTLPGGTEHANAAELHLKKGCFSCGSHEHIKYNCPLNSKKKHCDRCHRIGHTSQECRSKMHLASVATVESGGGEGSFQHAY